MHGVEDGISDVWNRRWDSRCMYEIEDVYVWGSRCME